MHLEEDSIRLHSRECNKKYYKYYSLLDVEVFIPLQIRNALD